MEPGPKWRRRKDERPGDIIQAALSVFSEKGFAGAKMDEIAARAGVSKGALYLYFPTKEEIFAAVVREAVWPEVAPVTELAAGDVGIEPLLRGLGAGLAKLAGESQLGPVLKLVIGESQTFPEIARIWHDDVLSKALGTLTKAIERAQKRGEVRKGDPRAFAVSVISPLLVAVIFRETFVPVGAKPFDIAKLINQHLDTILPGLLAPGASKKESGQ